MRALVCTVVLLTSSAAAAESARVLAFRGAAYIDTGDAQLELFRGMQIEAPATIVTEDDSAVRLRLDDGSILKLGSSTRMTLDRLDHEPNRRRASVKLTIGRLWAKVANWIGGETRYDLETANAVVGIRGTELVVSFDDNGRSKVLVVGGTVTMQDQAAKVSEQVGPFFAGLLADGEIQVRELELDELRLAAEDVHIGPQLSAEELGALATRKRRRGGTEDGVRPLPFGLWPHDAPPEDPLPLEPGVGQSRSFGRLEVRDD